VLVSSWDSEFRIPEDLCWVYVEVFASGACYDLAWAIRHVFVGFVEDAAFLLVQ